MRIVDVDVIPIAISDPPLRNSWGVHEPYALRSIVRLTTDDGCVGWGETYGGEDILRKLQGAASLVKGLDPALFNRLRILINNPPVFAAYETAMLDLLGKESRPADLSATSSAARCEIPCLTRRISSISTRATTSGARP